MSAFDKLNSRLKTAPKPQSPASRANYTHPNSDQIIEAATRAIALSTTGKMLLDYVQEAEITIKAISNKTEGGYSPDGKTIFISVPAGQEAGNAAIIIQLTASLREAMQDEIDELKKLSINGSEHAYAQRLLERDRDSLRYICAVAHELVHEHNIRDLFDEFVKIGYDKYLEAYGKDLKESEHIVSNEENDDNI